MNTTLQYFVLAQGYNYDDPNIFTPNDNGHIPGYIWEDLNGNLYRAIVVDMYFSSFLHKEAHFKYEIHIKPFGVDYWLFKERKIEKVYNDHIIEANTGYMVDPSSYWDENGELPEGFWESHVPQFDYFVMLIGKNIFELPVSLFQMILNRIVTLENLSFSSP